MAGRRITDSDELAVLNVLGALAEVVEQRNPEIYARVRELQGVAGWLPWWSRSTPTGPASGAHTFRRERR